MRSTAWLLASRVVLFAMGQLLLAALLALVGTPSPLAAAGQWWLVVVTLGNLLTLGLLSHARRGEGGLRGLWRFSRATWKGDLGWFLGFSLIAGPIGFLPNVLLARALWDAPDVGNALLFRPLPTAVLLVVGVAFPLTQALAELPFYFGHLSPSLQRSGWPSWAAVTTPALVLGLQHAVMPFEADWRYLVWRALMFLPFALVVGAAVHRRPTLMPWLLIMQGLMDVQLPLFVWLVQTGRMGLRAEPRGSLRLCSSSVRMAPHPTMRSSC